MDVLLSRRGYLTAVLLEVATTTTASIGTQYGMTLEVVQQCLVVELLKYIYSSPSQAVATHGKQDLWWCAPD